MCENEEDTLHFCVNESQCLFMCKIQFPIFLDNCHPNNIETGVGWYVEAKGAQGVLTILL